MLANLLHVAGVKHVITVEGISGGSDNPHPLQERMWKLSGSQVRFYSFPLLPVAPEDSRDHVF